MKLSAQLAAVLSLSPKAGAAPVRDTGAFAPAMERLIGGLASETQVSQTIPALPDTGVKIAVPSQAVMPRVPALKLTREDQLKAAPGAVNPGSDVASSHEEEGLAVVSQSGPQERTLPEENEERRLSLPPLQSQVAQASLKQARLALPDARPVSRANEPSRERHKTDETKPNDASNVTSPALPDTPVPQLQNLPRNIAVAATQPANLVVETGISKGSVEPASGRVDMGTKRRPVAAVTLPLPANPVAFASITKQIARTVQKIQQPEEIAGTATEHSTAPADQKLLSSAPARGKQDAFSMMVHRLDGHEATALQSNVHPVKESVKETLTVAQPAVTEKAPVHASPAAPVPQQQAASNANIPAAVVHRMQQVVDAHRVEATAAQVLQRMDAASPSSAVQLRADARHLDVGITSGSLGWVEVRASVNSSGKVDAALHLETNASAHVVAAQSKEIGDYVRQHSAQLDQISVGVGTGDGSRGNSGSMHEQARNNHTATVRTMVQDPISSETREPTDKMSLISIRA
jgi:soluble cytochrome b562